MYNIDGIEYLRIDTEGMDCKILKSIVSFIESKTINFKPSVIEFETNWHTNEQEVEETFKILINFGYKIVSRGGNTVVKLI